MHGKLKNKKVSNFCFDVDRRACFVSISRRKGKVVNISVSVDARMTVSEINTDETRY